MTDQTADRNTCDASMSTLFRLLGPCVLRADHDGPVHQDAKGVRWGGEAAPADPAGQNAPSGDLAARLDAAHRETGRVRAQLATATAEREAALAALAELRELGRQAETARAGGYAEAIANLRDVELHAGWQASVPYEPRTPTREHLAAYLTAVGPRAVAGRDREIADLRAQVAAAQDALAAAHRAGYEQALDNLRDRTRYLDWWSGPGAAGRGQTAHDHLADYLADTYEIPA